MRKKVVSGLTPFLVFEEFVTHAQSDPLFRQFSSKLSQFCLSYGCSWHDPDRVYANFLYHLADDSAYDPVKTMFAFIDLLQTERLTTYAYTFTERFAESGTFSGDNVTLESMVFVYSKWGDFLSCLKDTYPEYSFSLEMKPGWRGIGDTELEFPLTSDLEHIMQLANSLRAS
jgi:hypothetical protein